MPETRSAGSGRSNIQTCPQRVRLLRHSVLSPQRVWTVHKYRPPDLSTVWDTTDVPVNASSLGYSSEKGDLSSEKGDLSMNHLSLLNNPFSFHESWEHVSCHHLIIYCWFNCWLETVMAPWFAGFINKYTMKTTQFVSESSAWHCLRILGRAANLSTKIMSKQWCIHAPLHFIRLRIILKYWGGKLLCSILWAGMSCLVVIICHLVPKMSYVELT